MLQSADYGSTDNREGDRVIWCGRRDSNPHGLLRLDLNQVRLPFRHSRILLQQVILLKVLPGRSALSSRCGVAQPIHSTLFMIRGQMGIA
jgi:hypothetical protein